MKKSSFLVFFVVLIILVGYALWISGKIPGQVTGPEPLPTLTTTDNTSDIQKDLDNLTVTAEDEGFTEINTDLNSL